MGKCNFTKKWDRLTESKSTTLFALISTVQTIALVILQAKIFARNIDGWFNLHPGPDEYTEAEVCLNPGSFKAFVLLAFENIMFICFYVFQLYFSYNAILHQNTMQIFTIAISNFCYAVLGVVQLLEAQETSNRVLNECPTIVMDPEFMVHEVPHIILITILSCITGYLSFKLYKQFGWNIYQRIGTDVKLQSIYKARLIFVMLLKLDLLMMLLFSILIIPYYMVEFTSSGASYKGVVYMGITFFALVFLFESVAFKSIAKEHKAGMIAFLSFWILVMITYVWFCYIGISLVSIYKWYIGSIFGVTCLLMGVLTFVIGIVVMRNFGKGLKEHLDKIGFHEEEAFDNSNDKRDMEVGSRRN